MDKPQLPAFSLRLRLCTALATIALAGHALAQSVWTGSADNEFGNGANWTPDLPGAADTASVASGSPQVTANFVITELDVSGGNVTITNTGDLTATGGSVLSSGTISINSGGVLNSDLEMGGGNLSIDGVLNGHLALNSGDVTVNGDLGSATVGSATALTNNGQMDRVDVSGGGTFTNNTTGTAGAVTNAGTGSNAGTIASLTNTSGNFTNNSGGTISGTATVVGGTVTNNFVMTAADVAAGATLVNNTGATAGAVTSSGTVTNAGTIASLHNTAGNFTNNSGGQVTGTAAVTGGSVTNNASMNRVEVGPGGTFTNATFGTAGAVTNAGTSSNAGTIASLTNNAGNFVNNAGGTISGATVVAGGSVTNNFVITDADVAAAAIFVNNSGATAGAVRNAGNASNAGTMASLENTGGTFTNNGGGVVSGGTTVAGGTVVNNAALADVDTASGGTFTNNSGATAGAVTNAGTVSNDGTVASLVNTAGSFSNTGTIGGPATIAGGILINDGFIAGAVDVFDGGLLTGSGSTGALTMNSGGRLAPGPGIQVVAVNGDLVFRSGSTYQVDTDGMGGSDRVDVSGALIIDGGVLEIDPGNGPYGLNTDYTILSAASVAGVVDEVRTDLVFLSPVLSYGPSSVELGLYRNDVPFSDAATTPNERAAADAVEALGPASPIFSAILPLNAETARSAFSQLSGVEHASLQSALLRDSRLPREAMADRMRMAGGIDIVEAEGAAFWMQGYLASGHLSGDGNAIAMDSNTAGIVVGADTAVGDRWRLGGVLGYSKLDAGPQADAESYHMGMYAAGDFGPLDLTAGVIHSRNDISTTRSISFGSFADRVAADYAGATTQVFGDISWTMAMRPIEVAPFASLAYIHLDTDGFREEGGAAALSAGSSSQDVTVSTMGFRWSADMPFAELPVTAYGLLGWRHVFGHRAPVTRFAFAGGSPFVIGGISQPQDAAVAEAGVTVRLSKMARLNVSYAGEFGDGLTSHAAHARLTVDF